MKKGTPIRNNVAITRRYEKALETLVDRMRKDTEKELKRIFGSRTAKTYFRMANDAKKDQSLSTKSKLALAALLLKFQLMFTKKSRSLAQAMMEDVERYASSAVRASLKSLTDKTFNTSVISGIGRIKSQAIINANVALIKSIPQQYYTQVTGEIMRAITTGVPTGLEAAIVKHGRISEKRAKMIALDQTHKAMQAISRQKMLDQGISKFQWVYTFRSKEPRPSHVKMDKKIYRFDSPPVINADKRSEPPRRGFPGDEINCKCIMRPVAEWEK